MFWQKLGYFLPTQIVSQEIDIFRSEDLRRKVRTEITGKLIEPLKQPIPYNKNFIFHTKMPKCGSTFIKDLMEKLGKTKNFQAKMVHGIPTSDKVEIQNWYLKQTSKSSKPLFLIRHHFPFNFTLLPENQQPTYINIIRHPVDWYQSTYYFNRFGFNYWIENNMPNKLKQRTNSFGSELNDQNVTETARLRDINQCVEMDLLECNLLIRDYLDYVCYECSTRSSKCYEKIYKQYEKY